MSGIGAPAQPVDATLYLKEKMECMVMGQRFRRGFTAAEKTELWDRWKRGESLKAIGRAFGKPSSSIYFLLKPQRRDLTLVLRRPVEPAAQIGHGGSSLTMSVLG
jgi:hypothetical protein